MLAVAALALVVVGLHTISKAGLGEINTAADSPSHYVTGLMMHDCLSQLGHRSFEACAISFYTHYPKVGLGHWPPAGYMIDAAWIMVAGRSIHNGVLLMAFYVAAIAGMQFAFALRVTHAFWFSFGVALVFVCQPMAREMANVIMLDQPVALFVMLGLYFWSCFLERATRVSLLLERATRVSLLLAAVASGIAMLTKGNAYALIPAMVLSLVLLRRRVTGTRRLIGAAIVALGPAMLWTLCTRRLITSAFAETLSLRFVLQAGAAYARALLVGSGVGISALALVGCWCLGDRVRRGLATPFEAVALAAVPSVVFFHLLVPAAIDPRYIFLAFPFWFVWAAVGAQELSTRWRSVLPRFPVLAVWITALALTVGSAARASQQHARQRGRFGQMAQSVLRETGSAGPVTLISSTGLGEGTFIAEMAERDSTRQRCTVLRASQVLASSDWNGSVYRLRLQTSNDILRFLQSASVGTVLLHVAPGTIAPLHHRLLADTLNSYKSGWTLAERAVDQDGAQLSLYRVAHPESLPLRPVVISLAGTFRHTITVAP